MTPPRIRRLSPDDAVAYAALRLRMLAEAPFAFSASADDDVGVDPQAVAARLSADDGGALFGAFSPELEGAAGIYREATAKAAHKAYLVGMYVAPSARRQGTGRALISAVVAHARTLDGVRLLHLSVTEEAPAARALYVASGFVPWGTEPDAICHGGRCVAETHLVLRL